LNKPTFLVISKIDTLRLEQLGDEERKIIDDVVGKDGVELLQLSCYTDEGVMESRNAACDRLLAVRVEAKMRGSKVNSVLNKLHLTEPSQRDDKARPAFIPEGVKNRVKYVATDPMRRKLERDLEAENGGAGSYSVDLNSMSHFHIFTIL